MTESKRQGPSQLFRRLIQAIWHKILTPQLEEKKNEPFRERFENTMRNPFFYYVKYRQKRWNFLKNSNYIVIYQKNAFIFDFVPRKVSQPETCTFTFMHFPVGALSEVQNWIWKHFSHKVLYNSYSKKINWSVLAYV